MNKEIREILQITKELEQSSNFKLADEFTNSLIKLAQGKGGPGAVLEPIFKAPVFELPPLEPISTPKSQPVIPSSNFSTETVKKHNESIVPKIIEQKNPEKIKERNKSRAQLALKIINSLKKPNNIYSDYVNNSTDKEFKKLNNKVLRYPKNEIEYYILNPTAFTETSKPIARDILLWAFKMHITNVIPQELGLPEYSRSGEKPGRD